MTENEIKLMLMRCAQLWPAVEGPFLALKQTLTLREGALLQRLYGIGFSPHSRKELATHLKIPMERIEQVRNKAFRKIGHPGRSDVVAQLFLACGLPNRKGIESMNIPDRINDFLVEVREYGGFANDMDFDRIAAEVFKQKIKEVIEDCARIGDEQAAFHKSEADRLSKNEDASNCERTGEHASERIAARIRALAAPTEQEVKNGQTAPCET